MITNTKGLTTGVTATQSSFDRFAECLTERGATDHAQGSEAGEGQS